MTEPRNDEPEVPRGDLLDAVAARAVTGLQVDLGRVRREVGRRRRRRVALAGGTGLLLAAAVLAVVRLGPGPTALPPQLPAASAEDCQEYDPASAELAPDRSAIIVESEGVRQILLRLPAGTTDEAAAVALDLARRHTARCVIGDPSTGLQYWKRDGAVVDSSRTPPTSTAGVQCTAYDPASLDVTGSGHQWRLLATDGVLLGTTSSAADGARALIVAREADRICLVGDPGAPFTWYWVRSSG